MTRIAHATGLDDDGVDEDLIRSKQDALKVNGQAVSATVLDNFSLALESDGVGYETALVTAKAMRDWFELSLQPSLIMIQPGHAVGPAFRVSSISTTSPSAVNVPNCAAVSSFVSTKTTPIWTAITTAQQDILGKQATLSERDNVGNWSIIGSLAAPSLKLTNVIFEAASDFIQNKKLISDDSVVSSGPLKALRVNGGFDILLNGTYLSTSDTTHYKEFEALQIRDNRFTPYNIQTPHLTVKVRKYGNAINPDYSFMVLNGKINCLDIEVDSFPELTHITGVTSNIQTQLTSQATSLSTKADISGPTFTGTVALPSAVSITIDGTTLTDTIEDHIHSSLQLKTGTTHVTTLYSNSYIQTNQQALNGLAAVYSNNSVLYYRPMFCSELYTGGSTTSVGETLTSRLATKLDKPTATFVWPVAVTDTKLGYLGDVTSNIQAQIDGKQPLLILDSTPTIGNTANLVSSDGIASWGSTNFHPLTTIDTTPADNTSNLVTSKAVFDALALKQDSGNYLTEIVAASIYNTAVDAGTQINSLATVYEPIVTTVGFTSVRTATGSYSISFTTTQSSANYTIILSLEHSQGSTSSKVDDDFIIAYNSKATTGFSVKITEQDNSTSAGVSRNNRFDFLCIKSGRIICHGSISSAGVAD